PVARGAHGHPEPPPGGRGRPDREARGAVPGRIRGRLTPQQGPAPAPPAIPNNEKGRSVTRAAFWSCSSYQLRIFSGRIRKRARAGSSHRAPNMFHRNMKVSRIPISAWNLIAEKIQVTTPMASVKPVKVTALPVVFSVS